MHQYHIRQCLHDWDADKCRKKRMQIKTQHVALLLITVQMHMCVLSQEQSASIMVIITWAL